MQVAETQKLSSQILKTDIFISSNIGGQEMLDLSYSIRDHSSITSACFWLYSAHPPT